MADASILVVESDGGGEPVRHWISADMPRGSALCGDRPAGARLTSRCVVIPWDAVGVTCPACLERMGAS